MNPLLLLYALMGVPPWGIILQPDGKALGLVIQIIGFIGIWVMTSNFDDGR